MPACRPRGGVRTSIRPRAGRPGRNSWKAARAAQRRSPAGALAWWYPAGAGRRGAARACRRLRGSLFAPVSGCVRHRPSDRGECDGREQEHDQRLLVMPPTLSRQVAGSARRGAGLSRGGLREDCGGGEAVVATATRSARLCTQPYLGRGPGPWENRTGAGTPSTVAGSFGKLSPPSSGIASSC
jgi:hypothetical protein